MASRLPDHPSLEHLRREARELQRAARSEDPDALAELRTHDPQAPASLSAAQLAVARRYGFPGWPQLVRYLQQAAELGYEVVDDRGLEGAERFAALACLRYDEHDGPARWAEAAALWPTLDAPPIWACAAAADAVGVRRRLAEDPGAAARTAGPMRWRPILYLAYSRVLGVPGVAAADARELVLDTAAALLEAGGDPNDGCLWAGLATPFTVLTGVFGEGEQGPRHQPRHPFSLELAELLLRHGAEANDSQTLYNRMFRPDDDHLELLFRYGLGTGDGGPWRRRLGAATESIPEMIDRQLRWAADHGFSRRLELFAAHGHALAP